MRVIKFSCECLQATPSKVHFLFSESLNPRWSSGKRDYGRTFSLCVCEKNWIFVFSFFFDMFLVSFSPFFMLICLWIIRSIHWRWLSFEKKQGKNCLEDLPPTNHSLYLSSSLSSRPYFLVLFHPPPLLILTYSPTPPYRLPFTYTHPHALPPHYPSSLIHIPPTTPHTHTHTQIFCDIQHGVCPISGSEYRDPEQLEHEGNMFSEETRRLGVNPKLSSSRTNGWLYGWLCVVDWNFSQTNGWLLCALYF